MGNLACLSFKKPKSPGKFTIIWIHFKLKMILHGNRDASRYRVSSRKHRNVKIEIYNGTDLITIGWDKWVREFVQFFPEEEHSKSNSLPSYSTLQEHQQNLVNLNQREQYRFINFPLVNFSTRSPEYQQTLCMEPWKSSNLYFVITSPSSHKGL